MFNHSDEEAQKIACSFNHNEESSLVVCRGADHDKEGTQDVCPESGHVGDAAQEGGSGSGHEEDCGLIVSSGPSRRGDRVLEGDPKSGCRRAESLMSDLLTSLSDLRWTPKCLATEGHYTVHCCHLCLLFFKDGRPYYLLVSTWNKEKSM